MTLKEKVIRDLRNAIIQGEYRPGERLKEGQLCSRFKASRTPIREALNQLEKEGFIKITADVGAKVVQLSLKDVSDIFDILISLEGSASRFACLHINEEQIHKLEEYNVLFEKHTDKKNLELLFQLNAKFHSVICEASINPYLIEIWKNFRRLVDRISRMFPLIPGQSKETYEEHQKIIDAFKIRNPPLVEFLMREHLEMAKKNIIKYLMDHQKGDDEIDDKK